MRKFLICLAVFMFLAESALAGRVQIGWDAKSVGDTRTSVRVYERTGAAAPYTYTKVGEVSEPTTTLTLPSVGVGSHTYIARAWNGQAESVDSNSVTATILQAPAAPSTVVITIVP
jgi:hypothetical protein